MKGTLQSMRILLLLLCIVVIDNVVRAQAPADKPNREVKIKISKSEDGKTIKIDTTFSATDKVDVDALLKQLGFDIELGNLESNEKLEVIIKKSIDGSIAEDVLIDLRNIPDMPRPEMKEYAFLGVYIGNAYSQEGQAPQKGAHISSTIEGTGAVAAGLLANDIITAIDGAPVTSYNELIKEIRARKPGDQVSINYFREGKEMTTTATLGVKKMSEYRYNNDFKMYAPDIKIRNFEKIDNDELLRKLEDIQIEIDENVNEEFSGEMREKLDELKKEFSTSGDKEIRQIQIMIMVNDVSQEEAKMLKTTPENTLHAASLDIAPNPGNGQFHLNFELPEKGTTVIKVFDITGREIYEEMLSNFDGVYSGTIDISKHPKGTYFIQIAQGEKVLNKKVMIQ